LQDDLNSALKAPRPVRVSLYGVYDGHAGARAAQFCAAEIHKIFSEKFKPGGFFLPSRTSIADVFPFFLVVSDQ
jgi:serine/threonine protein phosphatase PrpC